MRVQGRLEVYWIQIEATTNITICLLLGLEDCLLAEQQSVALHMLVTKQKPVKNSSQKQMECGYSTFI